MAKRNQGRGQSGNTGDYYYDDGYQDGSYQDGSYQEDGYQDGGYPEDGYQDGDYPEDGYPEDGYYDDGYQDDGCYEDGYQDDGYDDGYEEPQQPKKTASKTKKKTRKNTKPVSTRSGSRSAGSRAAGKRRKKSNTTAVITAMLIIFLCVVFGLKLFLDKYSYSKTRADLNEYFSVADETDVPITWNDEISEVRAKLIDGEYYMALDDVKSGLNDRFYYGVQNDADTDGMILYCLPTEMVKVTFGSQDIQVGDSTETLDYIPAVKDDDGTVYLNIQFVQKYTDFSYTVCTDPNRLVISSDFSTAINTAVVSRNTQVRTSGGIKSDILTDVAEGDTVTVLEQMDEWSKVSTADGVIGYIENKRLGEVTETTRTDPLVYTEPEYTTHPLETDGKVNMAFHNVYSTAAAEDTLLEDTADIKTVNVIAPTIFWVTDEAGDISSFASQYYVDTCHEMGYEVWAVVDNINSTELTDKSSFLHTLDSRNNLISQLLEQVQTYGYDGINVDFELIDESYGQDYVEFIRELSIACRNAGLTLSVDNYPAYEFNDYYDIEEQGVFVDYVVVMGYDEHYAGSDEAGSVASIDYVTEGIQMAVEKVDKSKVINAVPFYSRIWKTYNGAVTSEAYGMQDIQDYIAENNMTQTWNAECGQNYAEMTDSDGALIQIWVEDDQSIQLKLDAMTAADIAGVAEWKLEFDTASVWDVIANYMNQ